MTFKNLFIMKRALMILAVLAMAFTGCHKDKDNDGYTVTFNANGGSGTMQPQTFKDGETKALAANAFTYQCHTFVKWNTVADGSGTSYADVQEVTITENITLYAQWSNMVNGHEWVDLGLPSKTLWATTNVGANTPEAYGDYFAWGETKPQSDNAYNWESYKYCNGSNSTLTKYCNDANYGNNGFTDTLTRLLPEDDAATANWGKGWRMPTSVELQELKDNCTVTWTTQNGVNGRLFIGPNGNGFFLPAAGYRWNGDLLYDSSDGYYWSSSLNTNYPGNAWTLSIYSDFFGIYFDGGRFNGQSVRPVCSESQK